MRVNKTPVLDWGWVKAFTLQTRAEKIKCTAYSQGKGGTGNNKRTTLVRQWDFCTVLDLPSLGQGNRNS